MPHKPCSLLYSTAHIYFNSVELETSVRRWFCNSRNRFVWNWQQPFVGFESEPTYFIEVLIKKFFLVFSVVALLSMLEILFITSAAMSLFNMRRYCSRAVFPSTSRKKFHIWSDLLIQEWYNVWAHKKNGEIWPYNVIWYKNIWDPIWLYIFIFSHVAFITY